MRIVFLGLAGAGKGTQAQVLSERFGLAFVSSGDLFRHHQSQGTELGLLAKSYMEKGELVPDEVTIRMILDRIEQEGCMPGFTLDGFPRTLVQAQALDEALGDEGIEKVLYVKVGEEELVRRLGGRVSCRQCNTPFQKDCLPAGAVQCPRCSGELYQRADDQPDLVRRRLQLQWPEITGLVESYSGQGKLIEVNGEQSVEKVEREIAQALSSSAPV